MTTKLTLASRSPRPQPNGARWTVWALATFLAGLCVRMAAGEERVLLDFGSGLDPALVTTQDAQAVVSQEGGRSSLRVHTGHRETWPGVTLRMPGGHWDLSAYQYLAVGLRNVATNAVTVFCRVDNPGADGVNNCLTGSAALEAGAAGAVRVELKRARGDSGGGRLFGMRGYPAIAGGTGTIDPANITQLVLFVSKPAGDHQWEITWVRALGAHVAPTASVLDAEPFMPFIDTFGQYRHKDWPGKTHSLSEMAERRQAEAKTLVERSGPAHWDRYGGWATGPQLEATGHFRTLKHQGRWWLVDPEGRLFFSHGIDCALMLDTTPIDERADWFEDFPGRQPDLETFLNPGAYALKGHYAGKSPRCYSFAGANLRRKYGPAWRELYPPLIHQRLRHWGLNTIGMWSDETTRLQRRTPYVDAIGSDGAKRIEGSEGYWGKFPDPFDPSFRSTLERRMEGRKAKSAGDPWCLGYFADNEIAWGDEVSLAAAVLTSPPNQAAKAAFLADLEARYATVQALNQAWGTAHASWEALRECRTAPDRARAHADLAAFYTRLAEQYFRTIRDVIRETAPHQLYLGCRFAWVNARAAAAAAKYCDIVSYNLYQRGVAEFRFNGGVDVPLIIGEFHFGALDRGMFHPGLVATKDQAERARTYREYVEGVLRHPAFVGCHWFQYQDEPTTGRVYDEENYQIGFVDIADTPYAETIQAAQAIGDRLYPIRSGASP